MIGMNSALPRHERRRCQPGRRTSILRVQALFSLVGDQAPTSVGEGPRLLQLALCRKRLVMFIE
jgi:hypothetical protein